MSGLGGLPNMGNKRLTILQKQLHSTRKTTAIMNDKLKESLERLEKSMDRQKQSEEFRCMQQSVSVKNTLQEKRALKKCLRHRRLSFSSEERKSRRTRNGVYDGASLDSMKTDVKQILTEMEPAYRRIKKVEQLKSVGYRDGQLVHYEDSLHKFQNVLNRPRRKPRYKAALSPYALSRELPLSMGDARSLSSLSSDDLSESGEVRVQKHRRSASAEGTRPVDPHLLHLPAIRRKSQYERSLPATSRDTTTAKLPSLTRRVSAFGPY